MAHKVKELTQPTGNVRSCNPEKGGCCSNHRRKDRVYEDEAWAYMRKTGESPWVDPENPPQGSSDFRP